MTASLQAAGARLVGGSDWSVSSPSVMEDVEFAGNRVIPESRGVPFLPEERLDLDVFDRGGGEIGDARVLLALGDGTVVHADPSFTW